jgi:cell division protein FtsX
MSDLNETPSQEDLDQLPVGAREYLKRLEVEVKELRPLKGENEMFKLQKQLRTSELELDDDQLTAVLAVHGKGEQTPEAIRATAERLKLVDPLPDTNKADEEAHGALAEARAGGSETSGLLTYEEEVEQAQTREELDAIYAKHNKPTV